MPDQTQTHNQGTENTGVQHAEQQGQNTVPPNLDKRGQQHETKTTSSSGDQEQDPKPPTRQGGTTVDTY